MARPIQKRDAIEQAVVHVVAKHGLHGSTIQDIAESANVSSGLLYRYWKSRDDLARDVYRTAVAKIVDRLATIAAGEPDVRAKLRQMVITFLQFADAEPLLLRFLLLAQHDLAASVPEQSSIRGLVGAIVRDGIAQGLIVRMPVEIATQVFLGIVLQPAVGSTYGHVPTPLSRHADDIIACVERALFRANG